MRFLEEYTGKTFRCSCGKSHVVTTREVRIGNGALRELPELLATCGCVGRGVIVCDGNTVRAAGDAVEELLRSRSIELIRHCLAGEHVHATAEHLPELRRAAKEAQWMLALGSGSINDMTKLVASEQSIPYVTVGTAPSMDGYLSANAAVLENGVKKQYLNLAPPVGMIADPAILRTAPAELTRAGLGDALGKITSLAEWKLNELAFGEFYCPQIARTVHAEVDALMDVVTRDGMESDAFFDALIRTLLVTGVAMQMMGNSTPASAGEHYFSHALDTYGFTETGDVYASHGDQVAAGTRLLLESYATFFSGETQALRVDFERAARHAAEWRDELNLEMSELCEAKTKALRQHESTLVAVNSPEMRTAASEVLRRYPQLCQIYQKCRLPVTATDLGAPPKAFTFARRHAPDMRKRLTLWDFIAQ